MNYFVMPGLGAARRLKFEAVRGIVLDNLNVKWSKLISSSRKGGLPDARKILTYFVLKYCPGEGVKSLGRLTNKDHSTIVTQRKEALNLMEVDKAFKKKIDEIDDQIIKYDVKL